jgi:hypothetical protein
MYLYYWSSELLRDFGAGHILVAATSADGAREKVLALYDPLDESSPAYEPYLACLKGCTDAQEYAEEYAALLDTLARDLAVAPTLITDAVVFIRGSA